MSLTSYIGSNVSIEEKGYEEEPVEGEIFVGPSFSDEGSLDGVKESEITLPIRDWYTEGMELREQTLIRFVKNGS